MELGKLVVALLFDDTQFTKGLGEAEQKIVRASRSFGSLAQTVDRQLTRAFRTATVAVVALTGAAVGIGARFDREIRTVSAILGEGEEGFRRVEQAARDLGATTEFTATQAATGLQNLARAGFNSEEAVAAVGPALSLATAAAADLNLSTASVAATLRQFQLDAADSGRVADVLANASASTSFSLQGLTDALRTAGPVGASFGLSLEQTVAAVSQFRNLGLDASTSGIIFRNALTRLVNPSAQAAAAIEGLGLSLEEVDPTQVRFDDLLTRLRDSGAGVREFSQIFGRFGAQVASVAQTIDNDASGSFANLTADFTNGVGEAARIAAETSDNALTRLQILGSAVQELFLQIFDAIAAPVQTATEALTSLFQAIAEEFGATSGDVTRDAQSLADAFARFLGDNTRAIARGFRDLVAAAASLGTSLAALLRGLNSISPVLSGFFRLLTDNSGFLIFGAGVALMVSRLVGLAASLPTIVTALQGVAALFGVTLPTSLATAGTALQAFAVTLVASTAGLAAIAIAIGTVVAGLISLIANTREAAVAQRELAAEQRGVEEDARRRAERLAQIGDQVNQNRREALDLLKQERDGTIELTDAQRELAESNAALTADQAQRGLDAGTLLNAGGQFIGVRESAERDIGATTEFIEELGNQSRVTQAELGALQEELEGFASGQGLGTRAFSADGTVGRIVSSSRFQEDELAIALDTVNDRLESLGDSVAGGLTISLEDVQAGVEATGSLAESLENQVQERLTQVRIARERDAAAQEGRERSLASAASQRQRQQAAEAERLRQQERRANDEASEERQRAEKESADAAIREAKRAREEIDRILEGAQGAASGFLPDGEQVRLRLRESLSSLRAAQEAVNASLSASAEDRRRVALQVVEAEIALRENANRELRSLADQAVEDGAGAAQRQAELTIGFVNAEVSEIERIRRAEAERLVQIEDQAALAIQAARERANNFQVGSTPEETNRNQRRALEQFADERRSIERGLARDIVQINETANEQVADSNRQLYAEIEANAERASVASLSAIREVGNDFVQEAGPIGRAFGSIVQSGFDLAIENAPRVTRVILDIGKTAISVARTVEQIGGAIKGIADQVIGVFNQVTGGFLDEFSIDGIVDSLTGSVAEAQEAADAAEAAFEAGEITAREFRAAQQAFTEAQNAANSGAGARSFVDDIVDSAIEFSSVLASSLDDILGQLIERIPELLANAAESIGEVLQRLTESFPELAQVIIDSADEFIATLVDGLPDLVTSIISTIGDSSQALFEGLSAIITGLLDALPDILTQLAGQMDQVIQALFQAVADIITSLGDNASAFAQAVTDFVDTLLTSIIQALPDLLLAIVEALPSLLNGFGELITGLITALIEAVPLLIEALLGALPVLIEALIAGIPELITGLISNFGNLFSVMIQAIPRIVVALVNVLFGENGLIPAIPRLLGALVGTIGRAFVQAWQALTGFFQGEFEGISREAGRRFAQAALEILTLGFFRTDAERENGENNNIFSTFADAVSNAFNGAQGAMGGIDFVGRTARTFVHPGEAVLTAAQNRERLFGGGTSAGTDASGAFSPGPIGGGGRGGTRIENVIMFNDREVDRFMADSRSRGGMPRTSRLNRESGSLPGIQRRKK